MYNFTEEDIEVFKIKYRGRSEKSLNEACVRWCHKYIRLRDAGDRCISCKAPYPTDAGHYYNAKLFPPLRYNEDNIHKQCRDCNRRLNANLIFYTRNIVDKIGESRLEVLHQMADQYMVDKRQAGFRWKWERLFLICTIEYYKGKAKELEL